MVIGVTLGEARAPPPPRPGSSADNDGWLDRKTRVARRYGRSSYGVGLSFRATGKDFDTDARLDTTLYAAHGGVFLIIVAGVGVVGTVGVSGLLQAQAADHAFVVEHLRAYLAELGARLRRPASHGDARRNDGSRGPKRRPSPIGRRDRGDPRDRLRFIPGSVAGSTPAVASNHAAAKPPGAGGDCTCAHPRLCRWSSPWSPHSSW